MNRYTYRAKRIDNNEWIFGVPYYSEGLWWMLVDDSHSTTKTGTGSNNINIETLCQCTGLQDRDGKDIFENDILLTGTSIIDGKEEIIYDTVKYVYGIYEPIAYWKKEVLKVVGNKFDKEED